MMAELRGRDGPRRQRVPGEWEEETGGDGGLTAAFDSDARDRDARRGGRRRRGAVPRRRRARHRPASRRRRSARASAGAADDLDEAIAGARAHNRWLADFCAEEPDRRIGVAVIPAIIPDMDIVLELVREAKELGHRGILIPTRWFDRPAYHDPLYEPVWTLTEELGLVLHTHSGAGPSRHRPRPGHAADLRVARPAGGRPARSRC